MQDFTIPEATIGAAALPLIADAMQQAGVDAARAFADSGLAVRTAAPPAVGEELPLAQFTRRLLEDMKLDPDDGLHWGLYPERFAEWSRGLDGRTPLQAVSSLELGSFLGERLLRDTDAASMAVSMEVRVPLLDHRFVESLAAVPDGIRYHPVRSKQMLRNMIADQIDPAVFERPKAGFELVPAAAPETLTAVPYDIAATIK